MICVSFQIIGVASIAATNSCDVLSCDGKEPGARLPDPYDCKRYYVCLTNCHVSDVPFECGDDSFFNAEVGDCDTLDNFNCSSCSPKCTTFSCSVENGTYLAADPDDCTRYFICGLDPNTIPVECPDGKYFDGEDCQEDPDQCCDRCVVYCQFPFTEVADPTNCNNFYYCPMGGYYPEEKDLKRCPKGKFFSVQEGVCSESASCEQPCQGSVKNARTLRPVFAPCAGSPASTVLSKK